MKDLIVNSLSGSKAVERCIRLLVIPLLLLGLANAPFWILGTRYFMVRPVFNIDVALPLLIGIVSWRFGLVVLVLTWGVDALQSMSLVYHFRSLNEFLQTFRFAGELHWTEFVSLPVGLIVLPFILAAAGTASMQRHGKVSAPGVLVAAMLVTLLDTVNGSAGLSPFTRDSYVVPVNASGSPLWNLAAAKYIELTSAPKELRTLHVALDAIDPVVWAEAHPGVDVVVAVVESLGVHRNPRIQQWLSSRIRTPDILRRWKLSSAEVPFSGATTSGELRTLCRLSGHYPLMTVAASEPCLPRRFDRLGYESIGLHGFSGDMFDRTLWWRNLGFGKTVFASDVPLDAPRCGGAFKGVCDSYLVEQIGIELRSTRKFLYLLTLNTHLPLLPHPLPQDLADICLSDGVSETACQLVAQHGALFSQMATMLARTEQPPLVLMVGDHAPPFTLQKDRLQFRADVVPQYVLEPR